jgi:hypothetical protein
VGFEIEGEGYIKLPCEEFGDIDVTASVEITGVTDDLEHTLGGREPSPYTLRSTTAICQLSLSRWHSLLRVRNATGTIMNY